MGRHETPGDPNPTRGTDADRRLVRSVQLCAKAFECASSYPYSADEFALDFGTSTQACRTLLGSDFAIDPELAAAVEEDRVVYRADYA